MRYKNTRWIFLIFFSIVLTLPLMGMAAEGSDWPTYKGAWFSIKYPPGFRVRPSLKSRDAITGYDSAFFVSPRQEVEFYVFSPHWGGEPEDIKIDPNRELLVSENSERKGNKNVRTVTVKDKAGKYFRSWVDTQDTLSNTRLVFGIKYKDQAAYNKYRKQYLIFKNSLQQFSD